MAYVSWKNYTRRWHKVLPEVAETMNAWRNTLALDGVDVSEIWEDNADECSLHMEVTRDDGELLDVSVTLVDSHDADGEHGPGVAGNLKLDLVEYGGRIVGSFIPYNYTDKVWAKYGDDAEWEDRAQIVLTADALYCIGEWLDEAGDGQDEKEV